MSVASLKPSILVCQLRPNLEIANASDVSATSSALDCLSEATSRNFSLVIVDLLVSMIQIRNDLFELCRCLRIHPLTNRMPVIVSIDAPRRDMAAKLVDIGVAFMDVRQPGASIDPERLLRLVHLGDRSVNIDPILDRLCPFIHYNPIDDRCELTTCHAYGNRMVLGGRRLHEVCESSDHVHCDYFRNPRIDS